MARQAARHRPPAGGCRRSAASSATAGRSASAAGKPRFPICQRGLPRRAGHPLWTRDSLVPPVDVEVVLAEPGTLRRPGIKPNRSHNGNPVLDRRPVDHFRGDVVITNPKVPWTNNASEQALKSPKVHQGNLRLLADHHHPGPLLPCALLPHHRLQPRSPHDRRHPRRPIRLALATHTHDQLTSPAPLNGHHVICQRSPLATLTCLLASIKSPGIPPPGLRWPKQRAAQAEP